MNSISTMASQLRLMVWDLTTLMFTYWILCLPFVFMAINKIIKLIRKFY